jgi:formylglycine-generating enzyme required for sulfatase activity
LGGGITMKLVLIPAGKFMMGAEWMGEEKDRREVTLSKPFYMGVTEVTQAQYEAVMGKNPSYFVDERLQRRLLEQRLGVLRDVDAKGETNPVETVSWDDATEFCKKLSEKTRQVVRLPTEAEWEYACRARTADPFGDFDRALGDYAWYTSNSGGTTHPVGQKKPNAWGLYDMHGNVYEWCADWYGDYPKGAVTDPQGPASGTYRVLRGGCWDSSPYYCLSALRDGSTPDYQTNYRLGFRVVVSVSGSTTAAAPARAKVSQLQIDSARKVGVPVAKELDLGDGVTMKLALIRPGKFMMGEEKDRHEVALSKPFYMGVTEVTQAQYQAVMGTNPSTFKGETNPVEIVSWNDATEFCKKLSEKTRRAVRLPTEAEWEYACRAGTATAFSFGDAGSALGDYAWYTSNSGSTTHPVGQKKPNAWGLYDMHGNVWEWCADWYGDYPKVAVTDPQGAASGASRVLRGGSWDYNPDVCRAAYRFNFSPVSRRNYGYGFRVAVSVSAPGL